MIDQSKPQQIMYLKLLKITSNITDNIAIFKSSKITITNS